MDNKSYYLASARTHNGCIKTDLPLVVTTRACKKKLEQAISPGQLLCTGKVYLKTQKGLVRIK